MKRLCFIAVILSGYFSGFSQSLEEINDLMGKGDFRKAKEGIDKFMSSAKNAAASDGWYFKGRVYNSFSKDSSLSMEDALKYKIEAFNDFKKVQGMDKLDIRLKVENYLSYFDLYNGFFDMGAKAFNAHKFEGAFNGFTNALVVEDYVRDKGYEVNGFKFPVLDTSLVLNTAIAARQAKNTEGAVKYYKMLSDANLNKENNMDIYLYLADYYYNKKDDAGFDGIASKGKNFYPAEPFWDRSYYESVEIENSVKGLSKADLIKKYDEMLAKYPNNFMAAFNYSVELYKYVYAEDTKPNEVPAAKTKFEEVLKKAITLKSTPEDNFLMANYLYNNSFDASDESKKVKGTAPADIKKRNDLLAASRKSMEDCIPYASSAADFYGKMHKLKAVEKANYKQCYDMLAEIYRVKGDTKKSADYKARKDTIDK